MLITDLPRCQHFRKALLIELCVGARSRDGSHVDNEIDSGFLQQISKFDDRPGRVAYGEKGVRHASNGRKRITIGPASPIGE
jgi:hypothetical protein